MNDNLHEIGDTIEYTFIFGSLSNSTNISLGFPIVVESGEGAKNLTETTPAFYEIEIPSLTTEVTLSCFTRLFQQFFSDSISFYLKAVIDRLTIGLIVLFFSLKNNRRCYEY
jgi:hypothetical protein